MVRFGLHVFWRAKRFYPLWQVESIDGIEAIPHRQRRTPCLFFRPSRKLYYVKEKGNLMLKLIAIVGTNSKRSTNRQLLQYMQKHFAERLRLNLLKSRTFLFSTNQLTNFFLLKFFEIAAKIEEARWCYHRYS